MINYIEGYKGKRKKDVTRPDFTHVYSMHADGSKE